MPVTAEPIQDLDLSILDAYDFDHTPKCDVNGCDNDATHVLICGECGEGTEYICIGCIIFAQDAAKVKKSYGNFRFDKSCKHSSNVLDCQIREI